MKTKNSIKWEGCWTDCTDCKMCNRHTKIWRWKTGCSWKMNEMNYDLSRSPLVFLQCRLYRVITLLQLKKYQFSVPFNNMANEWNPKPTCCWPWIVYFILLFLVSQKFRAINSLKSSITSWDSVIIV